MKLKSGAIQEPDEGRRAAEAMAPMLAVVPPVEEPLPDPPADPETPEPFPPPPLPPFTSMSRGWAMELFIRTRNPTGGVGIKPLPKNWYG